MQTKKVNPLANIIILFSRITNQAV